MTMVIKRVGAALLSPAAAPVIPTRRLMTLALLAAASLVAMPAAAQTYPSKPVTMVVPFAPGGASDVTARALASRMGELLGQNIVIDNKPGAGGSLGAASVARADPNGYTLLFWNVGMVTTAHLGSLPYDHLKDFQPVGLSGATPTILTVGPSVAAKDLGEFLRLARSAPGKITYGSSGMGASDHLALELFQKMANIQMTHVPYKGGAPATTAAMSGEIDLVGLSAGSVLGQIRAGRLRALAMGSARRYSELPDVPTATEAGVPDYVVDVWLGVWAPAGTPPAIVNRLNEAMRAALATDSVRATLAKSGIEAVSSASPQEFASFVKAESDKWGQVIRDAKIKVQ
jgi:tripartite-type tricarboxylate transporter receptor subunit TctC